MSEQPDPTIGETVVLPDYVVEVAELLAATENHRDAGVRAIRKIVIQAAIALDHAQASAPAACRECGCTDDAACEGNCWWVEPNLCSTCVPQTSGSDATATAHTSPAKTESTSTPGPEAPPTTGRAPSSAVLLLQQHGITAAEVREWAHDAGIEVASRGAISIEIIQHYLEHRVAA